MSNLTGLRALLVRPEQPLIQGASTFANVLISDGVRLHHCPVMNISPLASTLDTDKIKPHILDFSRYDRVIFVSRTAASLALDWLNRYWPVPDGLPIGTRYYAVGKSTAAELESWNIKAELPVEFSNSEGLLALPSLQSLIGEHVLIFSGVGGRQLLTEQLSCRGAVVSQCELYRRESTAEFVQEISQLLLSDELDVVIVHSGELLSTLISLVQKECQHTLRQLPLLVPGERVYGLARDSGFRHVICADTALPEDMVSALRGWYSNKR
ncbi:MAG: uroporphyrinogen-III synthase [Porticoccus sp.]|nr:uroporphyrinogen-III synthase [Porticoccus sp.]